MSVISESWEVVRLSSKTIKKILGVLLCLALLCTMIAWVPAPRKAQAQESKYFTILHTNDEHSEVIPADVSIDYPTYPTTGGLSRIATEIGAIKAEKAAAGEPVVTISGGDFTQGTLFAWLETQVSAVELSLMQGIGYDMVTLGNHEFEEGAGYRADAMQKAKDVGVTLPVLSSNIQFDDTDPDAAALHAWWSDTDKGGSELAIQPYTIKSLPNGLKVGFFGLMGIEAEAVAPMAAATGVTFGNVPGDPTDPNSFIVRVFKAQQMVDTLNAAGCDVVVCVSHSGTSEDINYATYVNGIDVIVGGHSHELDYPPIIEKNTIIVQAGAYTKYLGELELAYDTATGAVSVRNGQAITIDQNIPTVPAVDAIINTYVGALNGYYSAITGIPGSNIMAPLAETDLAGNGGFNLNAGPAFAETNLGDMITDSYVAISNSIAPPTEPVQLGIEANGVIRSGILKGGTGIFNFYDFYRTLPLGATPDPTQVPPVGIPFGYPLCNFYLMGAEIQGVLDATLGMGQEDFFLQISGTGRYSYRADGPDGGRVTSFEVFDGASFQPLNPMGLYKIATNFYTASFLAAFGVEPRTKTGAQTDVYSTRLMAGPSEIKAWQALFQYIINMPDQDGDLLPNIPSLYKYPQQRIAEEGWNMAEGATDGGMETFVLVQNPDATDAHVNISFLTENGEVAPADLQGVTIPAESRRTFKANDYVTSFDVSTKVEPIDGFVVCERSVFGNDRTWATDSVGVTAPSPSPQWYFAEGATDGGFDTWILVENPYVEDVHVDISFQTGGAGLLAPPALQGVTIPALSRRSFKVNDYVTEYDVSTYVECTDGMVVAERSMYGNGGAWGTASIGATAPAKQWYMAEGATDGGMETFVLIQNPTASTAHVDIAFQTDTGEVLPPSLQGLAIPANTRRTFKVNDYVTDYDVSTFVECTDAAADIGVVCERSMYGGDRTWATDSIGASEPGVDWYMAEGSTGGGMETFVLIQNPGPGDAVVNVTFQTDSGEVAPPDLQGLIMPGGSRGTIPVDAFVFDNYNVSTRVTAVGGMVICERSVFGGNRTWATDSIGYLRP
jgi:5'-nucleotidase/UDP-sugar diphosphatase